MNTRSNILWLSAILLSLLIRINIVNATQEPSEVPSRAEAETFNTLMVIKEDEGGKVVAEPVNTKEEFFNEDAKRKATVALVERGAEYFYTHPLADACYIFSHTKQFIEGELYLFLYATDGTVLADGHRSDLLWKNLYNERDIFGTFVVQSLIDKGTEGGGWVTHNWRDAIKVSYVKEVKKGEQKYVIGAGYFAHSKPDAVVNLVKGAVGFFNKTIKEGRSTDDAFSPLSYPIGRFVYGDLYLYALDFEGNVMAHGERPGLIGTNSWGYKDAAGVLVNQEIVKKLKTTEAGIWVEYVSHGAPKRSYVEKVKDAAGKEYFIACGYYSDANRDKVVDLVRKGYHFMKTHGLSAAEAAFSDKRSTEFLYGDLSLFVYDFEGKVVVQGTNTEFVGQNHYDLKDEDGKYYVRDFIKKAQQGGGWVEVKLKGFFKSVYVETVNLGVSSFIIGSGVYPISKQETMELLTKSGADFLKTHELKEACAQFSNRNGQFIRGDLYLFIFDSDGVCYVFGDEAGAIWRPLLHATDDDGVLFVQEIINTAKHGAGRVHYKLNGIDKVGFVVPVVKNGKTFIVGSSYFK